MKALKILLLIILFVPLVVGMCGLQATLDGLTLLSSEFHLSTLRRAGLFEALPDVAVDLLGQFAAGVPASDRTAMEAVVREVLEPAWVEQQVAPLLRDVSRYMRGGELDETAIPVETYAERFLTVYAKTATPRELAEARELIGTMMPQPIPLSALLANPPFSVVRLRIGTGLRFALGLAAGVLLLLAITFLLAGGFPGGARWTGAACLLGGAVGIAASILAGLLAPDLAASLHLDEVSPEVAELVRGIASGVAASVVNVIRLYGVVFAAAGIVLFVLAAVVAGARRRRRDRLVARQEILPAAEATADPAAGGAAGR